MEQWGICKSSRGGDSIQDCYDGPSCEEAGVLEGKVYDSKEQAQEDADKLSSVNPVGFEVFEILYINFGNVAQGRLKQQSQYASRYLDGWDGRANCGEGIRWIGSTSDYHSILIHKDDVEKFVKRVLAARGEE